MHIQMRSDLDSKQIRIQMSTFEWKVRKVTGPFSGWQEGSLGVIFQFFQLLLILLFLTLL